MSAYHSVQGERGGERERAHKAKEQRDREEKKRGKGSAEGGSFPLGGATERSEERNGLKKRKREACVPFGLADRRFSQIQPTQEESSSPGEMINCSYSTI